ncbi:MAG: 50S ribosomal protein L24 [Planctomycetes bacterium]|nr:50S ribosomal protein L24 [Planctomycetota bacterium]
MHVKVDDIVEVTTGDDKGVKGKVLRVQRSKAGKVQKVLIEGVNRVYKHMRRSQRNPQGGRLSKEMPIQASNVLLVCESCKASTRTGARFLEDGSKERFCKKCGAGIGEISPARTSKR